MTSAVPFFGGAGGANNLLNSAEFVLPLLDAGAGAVDLTLARGTGVGTFTRATTAWTKFASGAWGEVASGTAASMYLGFDDTPGAYGGYLAQGSRINSAIFARDMTNAAWVKTTMTAVKNAMGIDGVASSATTLTATAGNALALQTLTEAATSRSYAPWIRRVSGSGAVQVTQDGTTWTTVTVTSTWSRVADLVVSQLNPVFGIRLVDNGDSVAVDMNQLEAGTFASTPIPTTVAAATRNADVLTYPFSGNADATVGTAYAEAGTLYTAYPASTAIVAFGAFNQGPILGVNGNAVTTQTIRDGTNVVTKTGISSLATASRKRASSWGGAGMLITGDGASAQSGSFDGDIGSTAIGVGYLPSAGAGAEWFGTLKNIRIWQQQFTAAQLQAITAG